MCSTVTFQYKCGCAERIVFECPFPSITSSNSSKSLHAHARRICSRRYRLHQQKLFRQKQTATTTTPTSYDVPTLSMPMNLPFLPLPKPYSPKPEKIQGKKAHECTVTEIDEMCHDCWQRSLRLTKQRDGDDGVSADAMRNEEEDEEGNFINARVLREMPVNELILPPSSTSLGVQSSAESFSGG
ncbi:hypothetical protein EKO27_g7454 [Xylaria grammica]|uniref:Uncharacterized protein n=1 Tax=Xylaria grammica TaxID=363999 RepID=A0A439CZM1_9PEZI|nr:hypothetical protein EKO27_g7454 [Xylaria grammica]